MLMPRKVKHRKQKLVDTGGRLERFQRRLEKAEAGAVASAGDDSDSSDVPGDRRPGRPRGRHDARTAQLGGRGAQARRQHRLRLALDRSADGAPLGLRLPIIRGVVALGESLAIGFRALSVSANYAAQEEEEGDEEPAEIGRWAIFFSFAVAIGFALDDLQGRPGAPDRHAPDLRRPPVRRRRGSRPRHVFVAICSCSA